tara:strand:- start:200 stop:532 length:333 start_codon:yes stop_codon:yes gene_type:complete
MPEEGRIRPEVKYYFIYMTDSVDVFSVTTDENMGGHYDTLEEAISAAEQLKNSKYYIDICESLNVPLGKPSCGGRVWKWERGDDERNRIKELEKEMTELKQQLENSKKNE